MEPYQNLEISSNRASHNMRSIRWIWVFSCREKSNLVHRPVHYVTCDKFSDKHKYFLASVTTATEPNRYSEAIPNPKLHEVIRQEIHALEKNKTWELTKLLAGKHALGSKWVYKIKYKADGSIERYKTRLIILGNTQQEGVDFTKIFTLVSKMVIVWTLLSIVVAQN